MVAQVRVRRAASWSQQTPECTAHILHTVYVWGGGREVVGKGKGMHTETVDRVHMSAPHAPAQEPTAAAEC